MASRSTEDRGTAISRRVMYLVHRGQSMSSDVIGAALADLEVNGTLALVLEVLLDEGEISAAQLARHCLVSRQALVAPLNQLETRGLLRRPDPLATARVRPLALTPAGRELAHEVRDLVRRLERMVLDQFSDSELNTMKALLGRYDEAWETLLRL
jgi:DNA-binding MarR family transcriptional regulator